MAADPLLSPRSLPSESPELSGFVDYRGRRVVRSASGGWTAALFIIGVEIAERFAYYGVSSNLITYLTGPLQESTAQAAAAVNIWGGVALMLPLLGAFVADSYMGRYRTIFLASLLYLLALGMLTFSAVLPSLYPSSCGGSEDATACPPSAFQVAVFYISLYLVAFAQGGHKPCVQAFGADQFDENDPKESLARSAFFNWWYFGMCGGIFVTLTILNYIQDYVSWVLGFGIPGAMMMCALMVFLLGTKYYRFYPLEEESPFTRIGRTLISLMRNRWEDSSLPAAVDGHSDHQHPNVEQVDEVTRLLRLFPIWATCLIYGIVFSQSSTLFTKQGNTLDRRIGSKFQVPAASLQSLISAAILTFVPIYDRILVPTVRRFTKLPSGITMLQRIGVGILISLFSMVIAAQVEMKRLRVAKDCGLVDQPEVMIPMSLWWLIPQYILFGIGEVFTMVGLQEFFYDQVPDPLRSLGLALYLSIFGVGSLISGILISVIDKITSKSGESWFSNNLNRAHLDYFYWLLSGLSVAGLVLFLHYAKAYAYKKKAAAIAVV